ncbi:hypothetical protein G9F71_008430 [Clostridium sp. FP2]|uniref:hypothetical protein n=1 Tax=Clostridium sp. FP2 TaxID=2724481 RepID=UPI0013E94651|nr:hypothetical protein [Clostridium sp. FP2]MBZ9622878.1 hypothetical protein [Clostridium sp. FP2]
MQRDVVFLKDDGLLKALLNTKLCQDTGKYIIKCKDDIKVMEKLQEACNEHMKAIGYGRYKLLFANENNYMDSLEV